MNGRALFVVIVVLAGVAPAASATAAPTQTDCGFPVTATDATGTDVEVTGEPERVVTLGPSAAQTMWEMGAREKVVGVTKYASYLDGAASRRNVSGGGMQAVVVEKVVELEPDLVLAANIITNDTVAQLRRAGLTVFRFRFAGSIDDVVAKTELTGRLVGACGGATDTVEWMQDRLETVREAVRGTDRPTAIYPLGGGFVAGSGTFIHEVITTAGAENLAAIADISGYQQISEEVVVNEDPEWIILSETMSEDAILDVYDRTTAMREGQVIRVDPNHANQPAPRVVLVIEQIASRLHPDAYAVANATPTPTPVMTEESPTETAVDGGQPGLGSMIAIVALTGFVLLVTRRRR